MNLDPGPVEPAPILRIASVRHDHPTAIATLAAEMGTDDLDLVVLLASPHADSETLISEAARCCAGATVIGCTTAGEISRDGYAEGEIVAIGFPCAHFQSQTTLLPDLTDYDAQALIDRMIRVRHDLGIARPAWTHEFNFMLIDGLSTLEDKLTSDLAVGLGPVPLFGGSAGDGDAFGETFVLHNGRAYSNAAVLVQVRTNCPVKVFKTDHFLPTERRMVVTGADPARRIVHEINAEPAAREYARILGKDPEQLTPFTFAAHPVVVRIGGQHHVRSIQQVTKTGDLQFFSAIDEGLVLTLAEPRDMVDHLATELAALADPTPPAAILGCDCFLRRLEAQENQVTGALSALLRAHRVVGFSTYGEQFNSMHVNQTLTGVAIYPPEDVPA